MSRSILFSVGCVSTAPLGAFAKPQIATSLSLNGELWGNPFSSNFRFDDDFHLSGMNMSLSGSGVQADLGNISADWDQLGLASQNFQGMKMAIPAGKADLELLGGSIVLPPDTFRPRDLFEDEADATVVSSVYGLRATVPLKRALSISGAQLFAPGAPASQGKSINTLSLNYRKNDEQRFGVEMARSQHGAAWQASGATKAGRLTATGSYRQTALGFSSAGNPDLQTRRNGGALKLHYQFTSSLGLNASTERYNDGNNGYLKNDVVALRFAKSKNTAVDLFWRSSSRLRSADDDEIENPTTFDTKGIRVNQNFGANKLVLQYNRFDFSSAGTFENTSSDRFMVGLSRPLGQQTQMALTQAVSFDRTGSHERERSLQTRLNLRHRIRQSGLRLDMGIEYSNREAQSISRSTTSLRAGVNYRMRSGQAIGISYRTLLASSGSSNTPDRIYLNYSHRFGSSGLRSRLPLQERRQLGKVTGRVFEDSNGNGKWDEGEVGVSDVTVQTRGNAPKKTDRSGAFVLSDLRAGDYQLQMVSKTLPIELATMAPTDVKVNVPAGKAAIVEFPVSRTGKIAGSVFLDKNRNGIRDEGEEGAANVVVQAEGSEVIAFTDEKGNYQLHGLPPRSWKVSANVEVIGEDYENTGNGFAEVAVSPSGSATVAPLGIATKERAVVKGFEKTIEE